MRGVQVRETNEVSDIAVNEQQTVVEVSEEVPETKCMEPVVETPLVPITQPAVAAKHYVRPYL